MFWSDTFARAVAGVLMYRKYIPRVPPQPGLGLEPNHPSLLATSKRARGSSRERVSRERERE
jgi:hypothetical protein